MNFRKDILIFLTLAAAAPCLAQDATAPAVPQQAEQSKATQLDAYIVTDQLDETRGLIVPSLGATSFSMDQQQILNIPQGVDAPFSQVLLRAPGVAEDSAVNGDLHVRGEHANLQYRIDDVLLPEGISGFGLELDPRFVQGMQLITGSLPAQYGFRTAGVVDIQTKTGFEQGGEVSLYGGSFDTIRPSLEVGGSSGSVTYFADASYDHNDLGIENPTPSANAVHDATDQYKSFAYLSWILDHSSRLTFMGGASYSTFQVPDTPGLAAGTSPGGVPWLPGELSSSDLNETQLEQNYFGTATYQRSAGDLNYQVSAIARESQVHFMPDPYGDLYFNGVASNVDRTLYSGGVQGDGSYTLGGSHTIRAGFSLLDEDVGADTATTVFAVDAAGNPTSHVPFTVADNSTLHGLFAGSYVQDEWKIIPALTLNFGVRLDEFDSTFDREGQLSPRVNAILQATPSTTIHAGYSRYFTPPPVEDVPSSSVLEFNGTSNAAQVKQDDPVRSERADYLDAGVTQKIGTGLQVGLDAYYKKAADQLDDGLFGQSLILSAFNYAKGEVYGLEFSGSYSTGGFTTYLNVAHSVAKGEDWDSSQFLFDAADLAYVRNHWIYLDHDQDISASFGADYVWKRRSGDTRVYIDSLYGTGLRTDIAAPDGINVPNGGTVPAYYSASIGAEQDFRVARHREWKLRLDIVNVTDHVYELRNGTGVGVNAAQYGMRRGFFGTASYSF